MRILNLILISLISSTHYVSCYDPFDFIVDALNYTRIAGVTTCEIQLLRVIDEFRNGSMWAAKMFDANGKLQSGILEGNLIEMGSFDECMKVYDPEHGISGKYCFSKIYAPRLRRVMDKIADEFVDDKSPLKEVAHTIAHRPILTLYYGLCIPDGCTPEEINGFVFNSLNTTNAICQTKREMPGITYTDLTTICIFSIIFLILLAATSYDLYYYYMEEKPTHKIILTLSYWTNAQKLLSTSKSPDQLGFINGIRSFSIIWVMWGHLYFAMHIAPNINMGDVVDFMRNPISEVLTNAVLAVETFLFMSGMFVAYVYLLHKQKGEIFSWPMFYIHRYLRLTPAMAAIILVEISLIIQCGSGPLWPVLKAKIVSNCHKNWWTNLLYVQNHASSFVEMCVGATWYLAVDTQLYCISPLFLIPLIKHPKITLVAASIAAMASTALTFYIFWMYRLSDNFEAVINNNTEYMTRYYINTWTRATPWFMGFIFGYFIYQAKFVKKNVKLEKRIVVILWIAVMILIFGSLFVTNLFRERPYSRPLNSLVYTFDKIFWCLGLGIMIYLCSIGYGGIISAFLSMRPFELISKLSYCIFLLHNEVFILLRLSRRTNTYFSNFTISYYFWAHLMVISFLATIWTLTFESPIVSLQSYYRRKAAKVSKPVEKRRSTISSILGPEVEHKETKATTIRESANI